MAALTPMMGQYFSIKKNYRHCLLFYRLGDFYELFYDDAVIASKELDLVLTGRDAGSGKRAPMCGVPYHAADGYIAKLVEKGFRVAICEQTEPANASKNIVRREVIRVVTPGTIIDTNVLDNGKNNYIASIYEDKNGAGIAYADVSTGEFFAYSVAPQKSNSSKKELRFIDEIAAFMPAEIISNSYFKQGKEIESLFAVKTSTYEEWAFEYSAAYVTLCNHLKVLNLAGFGFDESSDRGAICAAGALLEYLSETQKNSLSHITALKRHTRGLYMLIDAQSRRNLELTETMRDKSKKGSLLWTMDYTKTAMGARTLRRWVLQPLVESDEIEARLCAVAEAKDDLYFCDEMRETLKGMQDIERLMAKVVYQSANGRDLAALRKSFGCLPVISRLLNDKSSGLLRYFYKETDLLEDVYKLIDDAVCDEPPVSVKDGGIIRDGYNAELDKHREAKSKGGTWLLELEAREKEQTGIKSLKIKYNKVFGYYIEILNSNKIPVPERYVRRQTLANCERYTTVELKKIEEAVLSAEDSITALETTLFNEVRQKVADNMTRIMNTANIVASIDALLSLAVAANANNYVKPVVNDSDKISIKNGRHPVVELLTSEPFIANDTYLDTDKNRLSIVTGPNMAGKSTFMRQTALICIMAQIGSFVPAEYAEIGVVDRVFTRVGASDDLATGQSTFMVEMTEVANILHNATKNSLLILDEIGRGTSTFDGLSIAWSVLEYIASKISAKTLFATHYHELTELEGAVEGVVNYRVMVKEKGDKILFLRKIVKGSADNSYGIQVACLAGIPDEITRRAKEILSDLNRADIVVNKQVRDPIRVGRLDSVPYSINGNEIKGVKVFVNDPIDVND